LSRALIVITTQADRRKAAAWVHKTPPGTRIEFKASKRTLPQNDRMWAMLTDVATQADHNGRRYTPDQWKCLFMHACGRDIQFLPSLDGSTFIPWGNRSSDLSKEEMSELIEFIFAWGSEHNVTFHELNKQPEQTSEAA
jgi:hypothetical protein